MAPTSAIKPLTCSALGAETRNVMWHVPALALLTRWIGDKKVALGITRFAKQDVELLKQLIEAGEYRPVVDRRYPIEDVVEAHLYVETGQKTGNVVLTVG